MEKKEGFSPIAKTKKLAKREREATVKGDCDTPSVGVKKGGNLEKKTCSKARRAEARASLYLSRKREPLRKRGGTLSQA